MDNSLEKGRLQNSNASTAVPTPSPAILAMPCQAVPWEREICNRAVEVEQVELNKRRGAGQVQRSPAVAREGTSLM